MNVERFSVRSGDRTALKRHDPKDTGPFASKDAAERHLEKGVKRLETLQQQLYAQDRWSLLLIFQGMDAAGKDHAIRHVMSGVSPQGTDVHSFKQPSPEELDHDFLWRAVKALPGRGRIGIFNRSYYEDVLVVRVHPELLQTQKLPPARISSRIWKERYEDINAFEEHLWRSGTLVRKFYLHVSKHEQHRRLLARLDDPMKNWKFSTSDLAERSQWNAYRAAFTDMLAATSKGRAPWYVVPADHKWFVQVLVSDIIIETLESLDLSVPPLTPGRRRELAKARRRLLREDA